jgi:hypothetical protein
MFHLNTWIEHVLRGGIIIVVAHFNEMQIKRKFPPREYFYLYSTDIVIFFLSKTKWPKMDKEIILFLLVPVLYCVKNMLHTSNYRL